VFKDGDLEEQHLAAEEKRDGVKTKTFIITNTLIGTLCYRKIDTNNTYLHDRIINNYSVKLPPRTDYEQTGRRQKMRQEGCGKG